jgi:hypothetical protein
MKHGTMFLIMSYTDRDIRILLFTLNTPINIKPIAGVRSMLSFIQLEKALCHSPTASKCHIFQVGLVVASCW